MAKWLIPVSGVQADMLIGVIGELLDTNPEYYDTLKEVYEKLEEIR